jgi:hypothetical protein
MKLIRKLIAQFDISQNCFTPCRPYFFLHKWLQFYFKSFGIARKISYTCSVLSATYALNWLQIGCKAVSHSKLCQLDKAALGVFCRVYIKKIEHLSPLFGNRRPDSNN